MGPKPPRRKLQETVEATLNPPDVLAQGYAIARIVKSEGNNLYSVDLPSQERLLVELPARFRKTIWLRRGGFVVVDTTAFVDRENKLNGEIVNVVMDEKEWRKQSFWPDEFFKDAPSYDEDSIMGKIPSSDDDYEEERDSRGAERHTNQDGAKR